MTTVRDRLATALMDELGADQHDAYLAVDVLLALAGVVIVDLSVLQDEMRAAVESAITLVAAAAATDQP
jgi:hypothetical protein